MMVTFCVSCWPFIVRFRLFEGGFHTVGISATSKSVKHFPIKIDCTLPCTWEQQQKVLDHLSRACGQQLEFQWKTFIDEWVDQMQFSREREREMISNFPSYQHDQCYIIANFLWYKLPLIGQIYCNNIFVMRWSFRFALLNFVPYYACDYI